MTLWSSQRGIDCRNDPRQRFGRCEQIGFGSSLQHRLRRVRPFVIPQVRNLRFGECFVEDFAHIL